MKSQEILFQLLFYLLFCLAETAAGGARAHTHAQGETERGDVLALFVRAISMSATTSKEISQLFIFPAIPRWSCLVAQLMRGSRAQIAQGRSALH